MSGRRMVGEGTCTGVSRKRLKKVCMMQTIIVTYRYRCSLSCSHEWKTAKGRPTVDGGLQPDEVSPQIILFTTKKRENYDLAQLNI